MDYFLIKPLSEIINHEKYVGKHALAKMTARERMLDFGSGSSSVWIDHHHLYS